jgi:hypothetical protein
MGAVGTSEMWVSFYQLYSAASQNTDIFIHLDILHSETPVQWVPGVLSPEVKRGLGVTLTTHPHLVPRWRMSRSYTSFPPTAATYCVLNSFVLAGLAYSLELPNLGTFYEFIYIVYVYKLLVYLLIRFNQCFLLLLFGAQGIHHTPPPSPRSRSHLQIWPPRELISRYYSVVPFVLNLIYLFEV